MAEVDTQPCGRVVAGFAVGWIPTRRMVWAGGVVVVRHVAIGATAGNSGVIESRSQP